MADTPRDRSPSPASRPPSLWRTALIASAVAIGAVWIAAWSASRATGEGLMLVGALVATPITLVAGLVAGGIIHALRLSARRVVARRAKRLDDTIDVTAATSRARGSAIVAAI